MIEYRSVKGFPAYRVGSDGSVWSCYVRGTRGQLGSIWRKLAATPQKSGHLSLIICRPGWQRHVLVHRLVLETFKGRCPKGKEACHFPDKNPANNSISNLRWDTRKKNHADKKIHGTANFGAKNPQAKLTDQIVIEIRSLYATGDYTQRNLAVRFGTTQSQIGRIVNRQRWQHI